MAEPDDSNDHGMGDEVGHDNKRNSPEVIISDHVQLFKKKDGSGYSRQRISSGSTANCSKSRVNFTHDPSPEDRLKYWERKWNDNKYSFHLNRTHHFVLRYAEHFINELSLPKEEVSIFIPLCGKSLDLLWSVLMKYLY